MNEEVHSLSNKTNPNSIYILGKLKFKGYKQISIHYYVDTGASLCVASKYIIPEEHWENAPRSIKVKVASEETITIGKIARNVDILIAGEIFHIPSIYQ